MARVVVEPSDQHFIVTEAEIALGQPVIAQIRRRLAGQKIEKSVAWLAGDFDLELADGNETALGPILAGRIHALGEQRRTHAHTVTGIPGWLIVAGRRYVPNSQATDFAVRKLDLIADAQMRAVALQIADG